jgi:hypothetical protein
MRFTKILRIIENWPILYNHKWSAWTMARTWDLSNSKKGPDHYPSWEVVVYNATLVDVYMPQEFADF